MRTKSGGEKIIEDFLELKDMLPDQKVPIKDLAKYKPDLHDSISF